MTTKIIIDGEGAVLGRLCSFAAKKALEGNEIIIVNSEKTIVLGNKKDIIGKYQQARKRGGRAQKGPYKPKPSFMMLKRSIRGMLPDYRWGEGRDAFKRIICYDGIPKEYVDKKMIKMNKPIRNKFVELKEISENL